MTTHKENTTAELSILPKGDEARELFYSRLNNWINLQYEIESAQEAQKDIMNAIGEDFVAKNEEVKKADVKKRAKGMIDEFLAGKMTETAQLADDVIGDLEIAKSFLKG